MEWIKTKSVAASVNDGVFVDEISVRATSTASWMNSSHFQNGTRLRNATNFCDVMSVSASTVSYSVGMILILNIAVVGNALVLVAMLMSPNLRNRVTTLFIVSLACSDIAFAVCLIPFKVSMSLHNDLFCLPMSACYWYVMSDAFVNVTSILNLFLIAMDRFIAIKIPFRYREILSPLRAKVLIAIVWLFGMLWAVLGVVQWVPSDGKNSIGSISLQSPNQFGTTEPPRCVNNNKLYYVVSACGLYLVPLAIMTLAYVRILAVALSQIRAIEATQGPVGHFVSDGSGNHGNIPNGARADYDAGKRSRNRKRKKELRATKSVAIVYCTFVFCFVPSMVITFIIFGDPDFFTNLLRKDPSLFSFIFYTFIEVLPVLNTGLNPFIYSFSNKQFRLAFKRVLYRVGGRPMLPDAMMDSVIRRDGSPNFVRSPRLSLDIMGSARRAKVSAASFFLIPPTRRSIDRRSSHQDGQMLMTSAVSSNESTPTVRTPQQPRSTLRRSTSSSPESQAVTLCEYAKTSYRDRFAKDRDSDGARHLPISELDQA